MNLSHTAIRSSLFVALGGVLGWILASEFQDSSEAPILTRVPPHASSAVPLVPTGCSVSSHAGLERELRLLRGQTECLRDQLVARNCMIAELKAEKISLEMRFARSGDDAVMRYLVENAEIEKSVLEEIDSSGPALDNFGNARWMHRLLQDELHDDATSAKLTLLYLQLSVYESMRGINPHARTWMRIDGRPLPPSWKAIFQDWDLSVRSPEDLRSLACRSVISIAGERGLATLCSLSIPPQFTSKELRNCPNKPHLWLARNRLHVWRRFIDQDL